MHTTYLSSNKDANQTISKKLLNLQLLARVRNDTERHNHFHTKDSSLIQFLLLLSIPIALYHW